MSAHEQTYVLVVQKLTLRLVAYRFVLQGTIDAIRKEGICAGCKMEHCEVAMEGRHLASTGLRQCLPNSTRTRLILTQ
jgi:hypothetical protein